MAKEKLRKIQADEMEENVKHSTVIGQFEGMCADADITNENGLDITREVWETVFASDIYKKAIDLGWYIGYLGHPEDPNCMEFQNACIVMREGHIDNDGKVYGTFDLVDTPVGRVVKSFIDAGVTFGISVRGAGDIIANSVDPETFVFRGFDLVSFPAYTEAIPTFTEIAASSDIESQKKYKAVCAAVKKNLKSLNTAESIDILQEQFAPQSDEYAMLEERKAELVPDVVVTEIDEDELDITKEQLDGVMELYLDAKAKNAELADEVLIASTRLKHVKASYNRRLRTLKRITAAQMNDAQKEIVDAVNKYQTVKAASSHMKSQLSDLKSENAILSKSNLKYKHEVEAAANDIDNKTSIIKQLRSELNETVNAATDTESRLSNLDNANKKLRSEISAANALLEEYQNAYASLYASAVGVHLDNVTVTASTSVNELQKIIGSAQVKPQQDVVPDYVEVADDNGDLITM